LQIHYHPAAEDTDQQQTKENITDGNVYQTTSLQRKLAIKKNINKPLTT
jgi:hypothetical protein